MTIPGRELLLDAGKGAILTLALFLAYVTFPLVGLLPGLVAPLPGIYYSLKRGAPAGIVTVAITVLVLCLMNDFSASLLYVMQCGLLTVLFPWLYRQGRGTARSLAYAVGSNFLLIVALTVGYALWAGLDLQASILKGIDTSITQALTIYEKQGLTGEDLQLLTQGMHQAGTLIGQTFPALLLVALGTMATLNVMFTFRLAARWLPELPQPESFHRFRNPEALVWIVIAAGFAMLLPYPDVNRIALNLLIVTGFAYVLQGLAVTLAFFQRLAVPSLVRVIFWLFLAFQPYMVLAVAIIGIFDIWGDFRSPREKNL
jgi:uncharacterized protein YybS (DUF2232 family)